jgi:hypothetical protein
MGQVHIYQKTLDKFTKTDFTLLFDALEQQTSSEDSLEDMKTRAQRSVCYFKLCFCECVGKQDAA